MLGFVIFTIATALAAEPPKDDRAKKDRDRIQGVWKVVELVSDGEPAPAEVVEAFKLVFKGDNLKFDPGEPGYTNFTYKVDRTTTPAGFDLIHSDGKNMGKARKGIYSLDGDTLRICFGETDQRPKELSAKAKSGQTMYVLKREKR